MQVNDLLIGAGLTQADVFPVRLGRSDQSRDRGLALGVRQ
jgi:hypothetical protein